MWRIITVVSIALSATLGRSLPETGYKPPEVVSNYTCPGEGGFEYPSNCTKWIKCERKAGTKEIIPYEKFCPKFNLFSSQKRLCVRASDNERNECIKTIIPKVHVQVEVTPTQCEKPGWIADPKDCRRYYMCSRKARSSLYHLRGPLNCTEKNFVFDLKLKECVSPEETTRKDCIIDTGTTIDTHSVKDLDQFPTSTERSTTVELIDPSDHVEISTASPITKGSSQTPSETEIITKPLNEYPSITRTQITEEKSMTGESGTQSTVTSTVPVIPKTGPSIEVFAESPTTEKTQSIKNQITTREPEEVLTEAPKSLAPSIGGIVTISTSNYFDTKLPLVPSTTTESTEYNEITTTVPSVDTPLDISTSTITVLTRGVDEAMVKDEPYTIEPEESSTSESEDSKELTTEKQTNPPSSTLAPEIEDSHEITIKYETTTGAPLESPTTTEIQESGEIQTTEHPIDFPTSTVTPVIGETDEITIKYETTTGAPLEPPTTTEVQESEEIQTTEHPIDLPASTVTSIIRETDGITIKYETTTGAPLESPTTTEVSESEEIQTTEHPIDLPASTVTSIIRETDGITIKYETTTGAPLESPTTTEVSESEEIQTTEQPIDLPTSTVAAEIGETDEITIKYGTTTGAPLESPTTTEVSESEEIQTTEQPIDLPTSTVAAEIGETDEITIKYGTTTGAPLESPTTTEVSESEEIQTTEHPIDLPTSTVAAEIGETDEITIKYGTTTGAPLESPTTTEVSESEEIQTTEHPIDLPTSTVAAEIGETDEITIKYGTTTGAPLESPTTTEVSESEEIQTTEHPIDLPAFTVTSIIRETDGITIKYETTTGAPLESPTTTEVQESEEIQTTEHPIDLPTSTVATEIGETDEITIKYETSTGAPLESPTTTEVQESGKIQTTEHSIDLPTSTVTSIIGETDEITIKYETTTGVAVEFPTSAEDVDSGGIATTEYQIDPPTSTVAPIIEESDEITINYGTTTGATMESPTTIIAKESGEVATTELFPHASVGLPTSTVGPAMAIPPIKCERLGFIGDPIDCHKYYLCSNIINRTSRFKLRGPFECSNNYVYDEETRTCTRPENVSRGKCRIISSTNPIDSRSDIRGNITKHHLDAPCPISQFLGEQISLLCPTGFRRHPKYCNLFYQCTTSNDGVNYNVNVLQCPHGLVYDMSKVQCLPADEVTDRCAPTENIYRARGNIGGLPIREFSVIPVKENVLCPSVGHHPHDIRSCSSVFYKCQAKGSSLEGYIHECPEGQAYWPVSRQCVDSRFLPQCAA